MVGLAAVAWKGPFLILWDIPTLNYINDLSKSINGKTNLILSADDTSIAFTNFNLEGFKIT